jgi:quercetin dioxygenase-like cupin family protein
MYVVTETGDRATTTPGGSVMTGLAAPSQGSVELSNWRVRMPTGVSGPEHAIDREQLWTLLSGTLLITVDGCTEQVGAGQTAILPIPLPWAQ